VAQLIAGRYSVNITFLRKHLFPLFFLIVGITLIYSNSLKGSFQFDDAQIRDRPNLHVAELNIKSLKGTLYWTPNQRRIYRPLPGLTLGLNYYFGGDNPFGYHIVNISIHILCAIAVYFFLQTLLSTPGIRPTFAAKHRYEIAVIAMFLFALHPIQTNVATYIIQRMTSMAALFYIISVTGYISFRRQTLSDREKAPFKKYLSLSISIISGVFSFLCKENSAVLPLTILFTDYLFFYNLSAGQERKNLKKIYAMSLFLVLAVLAYAGPKELISSLETYKNRDFSLTERLLTEPRIIFFYLYLLFIPSINLLNLNHDVLISKSLFNPPQTLIAISFIVLLVMAAYFLRRRYNLLSFIIVWFLGNLVIESTIIPLELIFEHRTYLPGVLIFLLISFGIVYVSTNILKERKALLFTSLLLILYGNGTYLRNMIFSTPISLWQDVVQKSPNLARAHASLGKAYMDYGYNSEARAEFEKTLRIKPDMTEPMLNLGKLYLNNFGMIDEAVVLFKKAQRLKSEGVFGCMGLGDAYMKAKDYRKAEHYYSVALKRRDFFVPAIHSLGVAKIHLGKKDEAAKLFQYGIKTDPTYEEFHFNLSKLYSNEKRFSDAIQILERYLSRNGDSKSGTALLKVIKQKSHSTDAVEE
jgi:tetratricopeptide (TPR) repeat protein